MNDLPTTRDEVAFLARRAGWGLAPGELDSWTALGTSAFIDALTQPDAVGIAAEASPWVDFEYVDPAGDNKSRVAMARQVLDSWLGHLASTQRPFENSLAWFWHDHFAVSGQVVNYLPALIDHLDLLREAGTGDFVELIRSVTTDAAMLVFLDGATSTGDAPNENYGRELLELYTVGVDSYTEDDVVAAARALTGWVVRRRDGWAVRYRPARHDDSPQTLLGVSGVHDVDSTVEAACGHQACPGFIATKMARHYLGPVDESVVAELSATFANSGLDIMTLGRAVLETGIAGNGEPQILAPVPWLIHAVKATGADIPVRSRLAMLRNMGQVPGQPPNVGGFPGSSTWLGSSATAARFSSANEISRLTPDDSVALTAAAQREWDELADVCLRPSGFSAATLDALGALSTSASRRPGEAALGVALASPDLVVG